MPGVIQVPASAEQFDQVRSLMRAFIAWHRERHREDIDLIDAYFDTASFELELASLPGKYVPPHGQLLLATLDGEPAGCVAMREIDSAACEMKRMFVYPRHHGKGIGHALAKAVIEAGRAQGYRSMRLDTSIRQEEAIGLYQRLGFKSVEPTHVLSTEMRNWLMFMELAL